MSYLLDTNAWVSYLNDPQSAVASKLRTIEDRHIWLCSVVAAELYHGANKSSRVRENLALVTSLVDRFRSIPFDEAAARIYGHIRSDLESKGQRIGPYDLLIAAVALSRDLTLVTHNTGEFGRVPGLRVEDWEV